MRLSTRGRSPGLDLPYPYTRAVSAWPERIFRYASYSAQAPSISTWLSATGGQAPMASSVITKLNACPAR
jgi:hypothetical protein